MATSNIELSELSELQAWFNVKERKLTLPSGLHIRVQLTTIQELAISGSIPMPVLALYDEGMDGFRKSDDVQSRAESIAKLKPTYDAVCTAILIFPKIGEVRDISKGIITLSDLSFEDKTFIYNNATGGYRLLENFRDEESGTINSDEQLSSEV